MATALEIVSDALAEIGVLGEGQTADSPGAIWGFRRLNQMLNTWGAENLTINAITRTTTAIVPSQSSYTVGPGGNINIARPDFLDHVNFLDSSTTLPTEYPLGPLLTEDARQGIVLKTMTSPFPSNAYYSPTYPLGTLYPWPIPTSSTLSWVVYAWTALVEFPALATTVSVPPAYYEALVTNLALLLAPSYGAQVHPVLVQRARDTMATLKRSNSRMRDLSFDAGAMGSGQRGRSNIYTGP